MTSQHLRLTTLTLVCGLALHTGASATGQQQVAIEMVRGGGGADIVVGSMSVGMVGGALMAPVEQTGSGILVGRLIEAESQRPVAGAVVTIGGARMGGAGRGGMMMLGRATSTPGVDPVPQVMTDQDGRFAFRNLPGGQFNLTAQKAGYLDGAYGRLRPDGPPQQVQLGDGERRDDVVIPMFLPAAITGRLVDDRGEPVVGAEIRAYRRTLVSGRRVLNLEGRPATTDDRGIYRIANLTPGEYVVSAPTTLQTSPANFGLQGGMPPNLLSTMMTPGNGGSISYSTGGSPVGGNSEFVIQPGRGLYGPAPEVDGRLLSYPTVYFPSALVASEAQPVTVRSGESRSGVDIALGLVPTTTIAGRLMGPDGPAPAYALHLVPSDTGDLSADPDVATAITGEDGRFMFFGVPAGNYVIQTVRVPRGLPRGGGDTTIVQGGGNVMVFAQRIEEAGGGAARVGPRPEPPAETEPVLWIAAPVSVGGSGIDNLTLSLQEGSKIEGRIEFEGSADRPGPDQMTRIAIVVEAVDGRQRSMAPSSRVDAEGRFEAPGLLPGRYVVRAMNAGAAWTLKSVMMGGVDVSEVPLDLQRDIAGLVVTFTDRASSIAGVARNDQGAADKSAAVLLFPADNRLWVDYGTNPRRMRLARTSTTGAFSFAAVPPGDYYIVSISEEFSGEWQDPRFLNQVALQATRVTVALGTQLTQDLATQPFRGNIGGTPFPIAAPAASSALVADDEYVHGPFVPDTPDAGQQARDARVAAVAGTSAISGIVLLDDGTNQPVRRARVSLRSVESRVDYAVMTDDEGRFRLSGLPTGRYSLTALKPAHVTTYYGSRRAGSGPGVPLALTEGTTMDSIVLRMPRGAVIAGRVVDEFGQAFPNASVRIMQFQTVDGRRVLRPSAGPLGNTQTDDRGQYRVFGLIPGQYVVMVTPPRRGGGEVRQLSSADVDAALADVSRVNAGPAAGSGASGSAATPFGGRAVGFSPVYYPGATTVGSAAEVTVSGGQVLDGIDVTVPLVPTARLEGTITGPDGRPVGGVTALLLPEGGTDLSFGATTVIRTRPDGTFSTTNVAPGRYMLTARSSGSGTETVTEFAGGGMFVSRQASPTPADATASGPPAKPLWAQAFVDVNGEDLSGLALTLREGMTVTGRVLFEGTRPPPADVSGIRIGISPAENSGISLGAPGDTLDQDGTFALDGVTPGSYRLTARVPPDGFSADSAWRLKSAVLDGQDTLDTQLTVQPGQNVDGLVLTFTDRMSELSGTVLDPAGAPVSDLTILVFPTENAFWSATARRMPRPQQPGSDGKFTFPGLPSGEYFLAAVTEVEPESWGNPTFMEQVAAAAIRITLGEGEKKVQDLRIGGGG